MVIINSVFIIFHISNLGMRFLKIERSTQVGKSKLFNFQENIIVLVWRLNELKWEEFFLDFIKGQPLQLTAGNRTIKLSVLKLSLRNQKAFVLGLLISHALYLQVFNAKNNLKTTRAIDSFLGLNKNFNELKIGDKSFF